MAIVELGKEEPAGLIKLQPVIGCQGLNAPKVKVFLKVEIWAHCSPVGKISFQRCRESCRHEILQNRGGRWEVGKGELRGAKYRRGISRVRHEKSQEKT